MRILLKNYLKINELKQNSMFGKRDLIFWICVIVISYVGKIRYNLSQVSVFYAVIYSCILMLFSCECITNRLFDFINKEIAKEENFYKKVITSNIIVLKHSFNVFMFIIITDMYFLGFINTFNIAMQVMTVAILALAIGNLVFIFNKNIYLKILKYIIIVACFVGFLLFSSNLYYKLEWTILLPFVLGFYGMSLIVDEKFYKFT
ncbi:hypothetical protein [Clostridium oceanicum]|uniref:ABC-2 family transporter protein n=1 Tax=Clostridium oceanicum TaxID=1543 RepID=A0ABP3UTA3_9CLOT